MTQIAVSDTLAAAIASTAESRKRSSEEILRSIFSQMDDDDVFAERMLTPVVQARLLEGGKRARAGEFISEEKVNQ